MSVIVNKTLATYTITSLQAEINADATIIPSCLSITASGDDLSIEFAVALSGAEDTELDVVIAAHVPQSQTIEASQLPLSDLDDGYKLAVHPSYKPIIEGGTTYAVWCGAGDELVGGSPEDFSLKDGGELGAGPIIHLNCKTTEKTKEVIVKFHPDHGRIWLHEAYIKFTGAPENTYISGGIVAMGTPLQQSVNLDLVVVDGFVIHTGAPGTGTDGFADASKISLMPRTFSRDGDWDFDGVTLTPNFGGAGEFKMPAIDTVAHRFVNRIPTLGDCPYFSITSDETTELPANFYVRVCAKTTDGENFLSDWHASVILEIYRQKTL